MGNTLDMKQHRSVVRACTGLMLVGELVLAGSASAATHALGWGLNYDNQAAQVPTNAMTDVSEIAAGYYHSLALKNGRVWAWGNNSAGQTNVPAAAQSAVVGIAAGNEFSLALRNNGAVAVWGTEIVTTNVPAAITGGVTQIAAGEYHALALKDGGVIAWGNNDYGQTDVPAELASGVTAVSGGGYFSLALKNGGVQVFGIPATNSLSFGIRSVPAAATSGVSAVAAGRWHALALKNNGVIAWGSPYHDATNVPVEATSGVTAIAAGDDFSMALKTNGAVLVWGDLTKGQGAVPSYAMGGVAKIAAGVGHCLVVSAFMPPRFLSTLLPDAYRTYPYSSAISATGDPRVVYSTVGQWPGWLQLNTNSGALTGTPTNLGMNYLTVVASNAYGRITNVFTVNVLERPPSQPVFVTTSPLPDGVAGEFYSKQIVAQYDPIFSLVQGEGELPAGLTMGTNGVISGYPTTEEVRQFTVRAANVVGSSNRVFQIAILAPTEPPVFVTPSPLPGGVLGEPYSVQIVASNNPTFGLLAGSLPDGLGLTAGGMMTGTPSVAGPFNFTVLATNSAGGNNRMYDLEIFAPPTIATPSPLPYGVLGESYAVQIAASYNPAFSLLAGSLPAGLELTGTGMVTGTPTVAGPYNFTVLATNVAGTTNRTYDLEVFGQPVFATPSPLPSGVVGQPYSTQVVVDNHPTFIGLLSGGLPAGLGLTASGMVTGTPVQIESASFTLIATNVVGSTTQAYDLAIDGPPVFVSTSPLPVGFLGIAYSNQILAVGEPIFSLVGGSLPDGLSLGDDGLVSGTPTATNAFNFTVRATNDFGWTNRDFALAIQNILPPAFTFIRRTNADIRLVWTNYNAQGRIQVWRATNITKAPVAWTNLGEQTSPWTNMAPPSPAYYQLRAVP